MNLLELENKGINLDIGYQKFLGDYIVLGVSIKNIYSDYNNSDRLPAMITIGTSQKIKNIPITLYLDLFHDEEKGNGSYQGIKFNHSLFNIICGFK